jgi:hypothetical protein
MISKILQVLRRASPLAVAVALLFHGGDDASAAQAVVSGEFVGAIPDSDPSDPPGGAADELVAVVVNDPDPTGTRVIRAYICDSDSSRAGDSEWFVGTITGDTFDLTSRSGRAFIQGGQLTEDAATGTVTLADGRVLTFSAERAQNGGGLFEVFFLPKNRLFGVAPSGAEYLARFTRERISGPLKIRTVKGRITTLEGQTIPFTVRNVVRNDNGTDLGVTLIVLNNSANQAGRSFEIKKGKPSNFFWLDID